MRIALRHTRMDEREEGRPNCTAALRHVQHACYLSDSLAFPALFGLPEERSSFLNKQEEKREWCALCMSEQTNGSLSFIVLQQREHI